MFWHREARFPCLRRPFVSHLFVVDVMIPSRLCRVRCGTGLNVGSCLLSGSVPRAGSGRAAGPAACGPGLGRPWLPDGDGALRTSRGHAAGHASGSRRLRRASGSACHVAPGPRGCHAVRPGGDAPPAAHGTALGVASCS